MTHSHLVLYLPAYLGLNSVNKNVFNLFQENAHGFAPLYLIAKCKYWIERTVALWKDCTKQISYSMDVSLLRLSMLVQIKNVLIILIIDIPYSREKKEEITHK